ncbi:MAG: helix-turn-helix domain-containing protein [Anaerolineae bacterium]
MPPKEVKWLSLQEASQMLGVHASTLRQWADSGKVYTVRTPGGHRRFAESDIRALLEPEPLQPSGVQLLVESALGRTRLEVGSGAFTTEDWYRHFDEASKAEHRDLGRKLLGLLHRYLASPEAPPDEASERARVLGEARQLGRDYGRRNCLRDLTLSESVRAFQVFQKILLEGVLRMSDAVGLQGNINLVSTYHQITDFNNAILLAMLEAYEE